MGEAVFEPLALRCSVERGGRRGEDAAGARSEVDRRGGHPVAGTLAGAPLDVGCGQVVEERLHLLLREVRHAVPAVKVKEATFGSFESHSVAPVVLAPPFDQPAEWHEIDVVLVGARAHGRHRTTFVAHVGPARCLGPVRELDAFGPGFDVCGRRGVGQEHDRQGV